MYFLKGALPWQGLHGNTTEEKYQLIYERKVNTSIEELCKDQPEEFLKYFQYISELGFDSTPNYAMLKSLFKQLFIRNEYTYDTILYDWEVKAFQQRRR